jgi:putative peptide zinc metalloprotease protein
LTFRGGSRTVLCAGAKVDIGELTSSDERPIRPRAALTLDRGRLLIDTGTASGAFGPLALTVGTAAGEVANDGAARYVTEPGATDVSRGAVTVAGASVEASGTTLSCGDGVALPVSRAAAPTEAPTPVATPSDLPPSLSPSPSVSPTPTTTDPTRPGPSRTEGTTARPTAPPTTAPPTTPPPTSSAPPPPPDTTPPQILKAGVSPPGIISPSCQKPPTTATIEAVVDGVDDGPQSLKVTAVYTFTTGTDTGTVPLTWNGQSFTGTLGPLSHVGSGRMTVVVHAADDAGNAAKPMSAGVIPFTDCQKPG